MFSSIEVPHLHEVNVTMPAYILENDFGLSGMIMAKCVLTTRTSSFHLPTFYAFIHSVVSRLES